MKRFALALAIMMVFPAMIVSQEPSVKVEGFSAKQAAASQPITITGPDQAKSGEVVILRLVGTPAIDLSKPLLNQLEWMIGKDQMFCYILMPKQSAVPLDVEGTIVFSPQGATMRPQLSFTTGEPGEYRLIVDWNYGQNQLVEKMVTVDGNPTPDPVDPPLPPPDPVDPPLPPVPNDAKWQVMFFTDSTNTDDLSLGQTTLLSSLTFREELVAKGHLFMGRYDQDSVMELKSQCQKDRYGRSIGCVQVKQVKGELKPWWDAVQGDPMPRLAIAPRDGGPVRDFPLPADAPSLYALLEAQK